MTISFSEPPLEPFSKTFLETNEAKARVERLKLKHPNRVPVFVERADTKTPFDVTNHLFAVHEDDTFATFQARMRANLDPSQALVWFVESDEGHLELVDPQETFRTMMATESYKKRSGMLQLRFTVERVFG